MVLICSIFLFDVTSTEPSMVVMIFVHTTADSVWHVTTMIIEYDGSGEYVGGEQILPVIKYNTRMMGV